MIKIKKEGKKGKRNKIGACKEREGRERGREDA